jgi:hypothetical protein
MEQTTKGPGRPKKAPVKKVVASEPTKKRTVKRTQRDDSKLPKLYETLNRQGGVFMKIRANKVQVFDEETNTVRGIRYCPAEPSIYIDEQSPQAVRSHVYFTDKMLIVNYDKPNLIAYLEAHPDNAVNGGTVFKLVNKEDDAEKVLEMEFQVNDAIAIIKARPIEELLPVAIAMNVDTNQKDLSIKRTLVQMAKRDPKHFMSMVDSPMVNARSTVIEGFDFQILDYRQGAVVWFDSGKMIASVPVGQDKVEVMTRFVMTDKGSLVLSDIERQLEAIA